MEGFGSGGAPIRIRHPDPFRGGIHAATGASAEATRGSAEHWEVADRGGTPSRATTGQILEMIAGGRIGLGSQVRRPPEANWTRAPDTPEFGYAFPFVNFLLTAKKRKAQEMAGLVALNSHLPRVLAVARTLQEKSESDDPCFWLSALLNWIPAPIIRRTQAFQMWDGFWVAPVVDSSYVKPGTWLNVYLVAFNLTKDHQERTLRAADEDIPEGMRGNLTFSVPPGRWAVQLVSVPANRGSGEFTIGFRTRTGGERAATAVAVGVLTLGSFVYAPGYSGFSLMYQVVPPETADAITAWEAYAVRAAEQRFQRAGAQGIVDGKGGLIPKDQVLQRFRPYLTPSLLLAALRSSQPGPEAIVASLIDEFAIDAFGAEGIEKLFPGP